LQDSGNRKFEFSRDHFFGDGYNDERMLNATAVGLVMGNAPTV
jgi:hydroxymethylpyrimidine pyrophosphatase-like HAD family hydrolase